MSQITVEQFANELGMLPDALLEQLQTAGVSKQSGEEIITEGDKKQLLEYLRKSHGAAETTRKKIALTRKKTTEIKKSDVAGKQRTIEVKVRKTRVYTKPVEETVEQSEDREIKTTIAPVEASTSVPEVSSVRKPIISADELAQREEEARRHAKLSELQEIEFRKKTEKKVQPKVSEVIKEEPKQEVPVEKVKNTAELASQPAVQQPKSTITVKHEEKPEKKKKQIKQQNLLSEETGKRRETKKHDLNQVDGWRIRKTNKNAKTSSNESAELHRFTEPTEPIKYEVMVPETISVAALAQKMSVKAAEVIRVLMKMGIMVTINQMLDQDTAMIVVEELGHIAKYAAPDNPESYLEEEKASQSDAIAEPRAPVVTVMGHVDHGKTSLLDYIRRTRVAGGEAGGITQHIGAYHVETAHGMITFLDTPGHEAFTAMRARGAKITDIVVLVVAADDGVMPQTIEAIHHAKAAKIPIVVAVNKMDKPEANFERIKQELVTHGVVAEDWGGEVIFVGVSAKTGLGIDELLESILLQAEVLELKAVKAAPAKGVVIESRLDKGRGPVATILIQSGTLKRGDVLLTGAAFGKVRAMLDENGNSIESASMSIPVEIQGLSDVAVAGETVLALEDERRAREIALFRQGKFRDVRLDQRQVAKMEEVFNQKDDIKILNLIIKADAQGSAEALAYALQKLATDEVKINIIHSGVGAIIESDINLALASKAIIIGFNSRADAGARKLVATTGVDIHYYNVIYDAVDEIKKALSGMLLPERKENIIGLIDIREIFRISKIGVIAGCYVLEGFVKRDSMVRVLRDGVVIHSCALDSLKRFKDDVREVKAGFECGLSLKNYNDIQVGDQLEVYEVVEVMRTL